MNFAHTIADAAAVGFQFFLARAANTDAPGSASRPARAATTTFAAQTGHRGALPSQSRQQIVQLGQFHLQLAFAASGVPGKNVENELRPVNHAAIRGSLDVSLLNGRKVAVEDDERSFVRRCFSPDFVQLTASDQCGRIGSFAQLEDGASNLCACAVRQLDQFGKGFAALFTCGHAGETGRTLPSHADQQGALRCRDLVLCFRHRSRPGVTIGLALSWRNTSKELYTPLANPATSFYTLRLQKFEDGSLQFRIVAKARKPLDTRFFAKPG